MEASDRVLSMEDCLLVARRYFGQDDVQVTEWQEGKLSDKPAGFLGEHLLAEVEAFANGRQERISVFVKTLPPNSNQASLIKTTGAFKKEVLFYKYIIPAMEERGIISNRSVANRQLNGRDKSKDEEVSWNCRCFVAREEVVILENLALLGYKSDCARNDFDYEHTLMALQMLASYHAASIAYEEQRSAELKRPFRISEQFPELVKETFYVIEDNHPGEKTTEVGIEGIVKCAKQLPICADPSVRRRVKERLPDLLRKMYRAVRPSPHFRNVLCHADLWQNNVLFQHSADGRPLDVKLVDYQLLRYAPPAHDIFDLLYLGTRRALREQHETALLNAYYSSLAAALGRRGVSADVALPRSAFNASLPEQRFAGRLSAAFTLHFILSGDEAIQPMIDNPDEYARVVWEVPARAHFICSQFKNDPVYRERYQECLTELIEKHML